MLVLEERVQFRWNDPPEKAGLIKPNQISARRWHFLKKSPVQSPPAGENKNKKASAVLGCPSKGGGCSIVASRIRHWGMFQNFRTPFSGSQFLCVAQERRPELENALFVVFGFVLAQGLVALQAARKSQHSSSL